ncbi:acetyl/propionyl/methylcrotonyl-CoA carboxylase subunit alpha [Rivibacter subsaxonicus]|uniref:Geranyl-CoA carboxylase alpha subunit n=1 Tax=Rivibacter subsaxonicus TaxID=457575 RepID=A0A4Q7VW73_9BURK|nr:biotin carboxylase N-terminal domain-containing protein [Rivibacter subsaxonicus]RZU00964.1 geranyl-CoA carboxylase alpha subunit [Rivibacter subsaxonicus]
MKKILIANRGEIACRVMRTARALGYRTVAVFSDADAAAPHVALADEAVRIGPAPAAESYLSFEAVLGAARATGADALHPGYGFLSENAAFAQACLDAGVVFIGPPASAIEAMGDKARAKRRMIEAGVPCAPGYLDADAGDEQLIAAARQLGLPLLVKAVAGGGGRGMRLVRHEVELPAAIAGARREALSAFGDGTLMLERLIEGGRHIEIQVFADAHGHAVHLGERDCTAQRRRQKVIEEAPSPIVDAAMRARMGADAVAAALAVGYVGAGTVEFIVDADRRHYFLEMNTRLQVEHPVTECITGFNLVEWQLRIAAGEPLTAWLPRLQEDVRFEGHAIEARLYAEDPYGGFRPQTGRIAHWRPGRALQLGVRIDSGICEGGEITPFYDPMVAKIIAHGRTREDAIRRLTAALDDAPLLGVVNNGRFLRELINHEAFAGAAMHTALIDQWAEQGEPLLQRPLPSDEDWALAAAARALRDGAGARPASLVGFGIELQCGDERRTLRVGAGGIRLLSMADGQVRYELDGVQRQATLVDDGEQLHVVRDAAVFTFSEPSPFPSSGNAADPARALAPVAGLVAQVLVAVGDRVVTGQPLACVEAMKMEMWINAAAAGTVRAVHAKARAQVAAAELLVELDIEEAKES